MKNKIKTKLGYIKSMPRPTQKYLDEFYSNLYFKDGITSTYNNKYNKKERFFKEFRAEITINFLLENLKNPKRKINFLEIGSGQGFLMNAALKTNWKIKGVDYQSEPIKKINKKVLSFFIENDPSKFISDSIKNKDRFDIIHIKYKPSKTFADKFAKVSSSLSGKILSAFSQKSYDDNIFK